MCDMAHCGPVVDWRCGNLPGDADAWFAWLLMMWLCSLDWGLLLIAANVCLFMLVYFQLHDICTWYDAVNVHDIVYVYANVDEYVYDIVCVYVDVYVFDLFFMQHMMKFGHWWQHISCQFDSQFNVCVCVYVNNVLQILFSFSDFIFWFGNSISIFWFGFFIFIF